MQPREHSMLCMITILPNFIFHINNFLHWLLTDPVDAIPTMSRVKYTAKRPITIIASSTRTTVSNIGSTLICAI